MTLSISLTYIQKKTLLNIDNKKAYDNNQIRERECLDWLKKQKKTVNQGLYITASIGVFQGVLVIAQSALLAYIVHQLVIEQAPLIQLMSMFGWLVLTFILRSICSYYFPVMGFKVAEQIKRTVREQVLNKFSQLGPAFCKQQQSGELAATTLEHTEALENYYSRYLPQQIIVSVLPLIMIAVVLPVNWIVAVIFLVTGPLVPVFMALVGMGAASASRSQFLAMARMSGYFLDRLQGLSTLKLFSQAEAELTNITKISTAFREKTMNVLHIAFLSSAVLEFFSAVAVALVAVYVGLGLLGLIRFGPAINISLQEALFVLLIAPEFFNPLKQLAVYYHDKAAAIAAADNILKVLQQVTNEQIDKVDIKPTKSTVYAIEMLAVSKSYQNKQVIKSLNLQIATGENVALVGESGVGKTTAFNLLLGFEQATEGVILINGQPVNKQNNIAWAGQQSHVFYASIKDNISLFDPELSDSQINTAADRAGVTEFSQYLENGLSTLVGEKGYGLSGGQVQRIALARAFVQNSAIVLLDEPTAHLDQQTKTKLLQLIESLFKDKTLLIASHDADVIDKMDRVIQLT
mgnify:FL=1